MEFNNLTDSIVSSIYDETNLVEATNNYDQSCSVCGMDEWCGTDGCPYAP